MEKFNVYTKKVEAVEPMITIADLIPVGRENAITREMLLAKCKDYDLCTTDRKMRMLITRARVDYVILNLSDGNGYYIPSIEEQQELQRYIRQEEHRAKQIFKNLKTARALYDDYLHGRIPKEDGNGLEE